MPAPAATAHLSPVPGRVAAAHPSVRAAARSTRARSLRAQARQVHPLVAQAYVRRAAELERTGGAWSGRPAAETTLATGEAPAAA